MNKHTLYLFTVLFLCMVFDSMAGSNNSHQFTLAMNEKAKALEAEKAEKFLQAAGHFEKAVSLGLSKNFGLWKTVDMYAKGGDFEKALMPMEILADSGSTEINYFQLLAGAYAETYADQYAAILSQVKLNIEQAGVQGQSKQAKKGQIYTQDVKHFFAAFDQAKNIESPLKKRRIYEKIYFNNASKGMVDYASMKIGSIPSFVDYVEKNRAFYEDVRLASNKLNGLIPTAKAAMNKMKYHQPTAVTSDIYFIVGMHTSAGTASDNGILLGADFIAESRANISGLAEWTHPYITDAEDKVWVVVHEYVHVLQNTSHETVLGNALVEGGADFLANLLYEPPKKASEYTKFGLANEAMIKAEFSAQLDSTDISMWTGNNGDTLPENWVPDLGYFIGHQIAQAYYQQANDKSQAIRDLLTLKDSHAILAKSGYLVLDSASE